jgi:hypothetical protein
MGAISDSFSNKNRVGETKNLLLKAGYHPYGHELLYNGQTGLIMIWEKFCWTYLLHSKQVDDRR